MLVAMEPLAAIVVMGVSGSGKSRVGRLLAERLGWTFADADDFHPVANVAKMRSGVPLDDADREPWLGALASVLRVAMSDRRPIVLACSALKRTYREQLGLPHPRMRLIHLTGPEDVLRQRIEQRAGHFMPASLLDSQLATLEPPSEAEQPLVVDVSEPAENVVRRLTAALGLP